jgi:hypothetical protein
MRLPFLQLESDIISHGAAEVSNLAGCSIPEALGHIALVRAWAVSHATDEAPPDGWVEGDAAGRRIEAAAHWKGEKGTLLQALIDAGHVRPETGGHRVLRLEPYVKAWEQNRKAKARMKNVRERSANIAVPEQHGERTAGERSAKFDGQTQTQTQTQTEEAALSADASPRAADDDLPDGTEHAEDDPQPVLLAVPSKPTEKPEDLQALWNAEAHASLPRWQGMSATRKQRATARLRERPLAQWREVIRRLSASPFCRGEEKGSAWKASPDWILQPDVADKVLEGKYDRPGATPAVLSREDEQARKRREAYERMTAAGGAQ